MSSLCYECQFPFKFKIELIGITKISHFASLCKETEGNWEMAYYSSLYQTQSFLLSASQFSSKKKNKIVYRGTIL